MTEKMSRGQPKFEPTQDQCNQVKLMKALGIPEDRICKMITNPRSALLAPAHEAAFGGELTSTSPRRMFLAGVKTGKWPTDPNIPRRRIPVGMRRRPKMQ
jgi:hypothetical protein